MRVEVEPTVWRMERAEVARIDAGVPADAVVPMPERDPEAIPRPSVTAPSPGLDAAEDTSSSPRGWDRSSPPVRWAVLVVGFAGLAALVFALALVGHRVAAITLVAVVSLARTIIVAGRKPRS